MNDKQLRREAMLKCIPLDKLLKRAANKEDVERQARDMEKNARDDVNRDYEQRKQKRKRQDFMPNRHTLWKRNHRTVVVRVLNASTADIRMEVKGQCVRGAGQLSNFCKKKGNFARVCLAQNTAGKDSRRLHAHQLGQFENTENTFDSNYVFSLPISAAARHMINVKINGTKGRMDADSCSSANMDIDQ